jgi:hypothetical protein
MEYGSGIFIFEGNAGRAGGEKELKEKPERLGIDLADLGLSVLRPYMGWWSLGLWGFCRRR